MTKFFFNIQTDQETLLDEEGISLASSEHATNEARVAAKEMAAEAVPRDGPVDGTRIDVMDEDGDLFASVLLSKMSKISLKRHRAT